MENVDDIVWDVEDKEEGVVYHCEKCGCEVNLYYANTVVANRRFPRPFYSERNHKLYVKQGSSQIIPHVKLCDTCVEEFLDVLKTWLG